MIPDHITTYEGKITYVVTSALIIAAKIAIAIWLIWRFGLIGSVVGAMMMIWLGWRVAIEWLSTERRGKKLRSDRF